MQKTISKSTIEEVVATYLAEKTEEFLVEVIALPAYDFEVVLDSDSSVSIETCIGLTRLIEDSFDRETQDYSLTVGSAGIGNPLKLSRQLDKVLTKDVEVVGKDGSKWVAKLVAHDEQGIEVSYVVKEAVEGKKRKVEVEKQERIEFENIKSICEALFV